jgi:hypothetical protein
VTVQVPDAEAVTAPLVASTAQIDGVVVPYRTGSPELAVADTTADAWFTSGVGAGAKVMTCGSAWIRGPPSHDPSTPAERAARTRRRAICAAGSMRVLCIRGFTG